jgi:hypothetical protein
VIFSSNSTFFTIIVPFSSEPISTSPSPSEGLAASLKISSLSSLALEAAASFLIPQRANHPFLPSLL